MKRRRSQTNLGYNGRTPRKQQKTIQYIPRPIMPEKKGMDTTIDLFSGSTYTTNAGIVVLNLVRAGTGSYNRIGRKIKPKSLRLKGTLSYTETANANVVGTVCKIYIVYDKQPSGGLIPTYNSIFGQTDQAGTETVDFNSGPKYDSMGRFRILRELSYDMNPQTISGYDYTHTINLDEYIKLALPETVYSGDSSPMTISDINTGAIYFITRASTGLVTVDVTARLRYTDA